MMKEKRTGVAGRMRQSKEGFGDAEKQLHSDDFFPVIIWPEKLKAMRRIQEHAVVRGRRKDLSKAISRRRAP